MSRVYDMAFNDCDPEECPSCGEETYDSDGEFCENCGDVCTVWGDEDGPYSYSSDDRDWDDINNHLPFVRVYVHSERNAKGVDCWAYTAVKRVNGEKRYRISSYSGGDVIVAAKKFLETLDQPHCVEFFTVYDSVVTRSSRKDHGPDTDMRLFWMSVKKHAVKWSLQRQPTINDDHLNSVELAERCAGLRS